MHELIYGLDIETDTTVDGLDPAVSPVVTAALSTAAGDEVFTGDEAALLAALDERLRDLPPGVIATWNGATFDLPFVADRAAVCGVALGLRLTRDPTVVLHRDPLAGHLGAYRATWYAHGHLDAYRIYRSDVGRVLGVSCGLKSIARMVGLAAVEVDRERIHELPPAALAAYVASDARLTRLLVVRRLPGALAAQPALRRTAAAVTPPY
ncbi:MAG TPA: 3'-5' exonuclease [Acidimicrobiales bacterium]|nr:3'-5' exonuclease [Acidimicrobiales bacterium]